MSNVEHNMFRNTKHKNIMSYVEHNMVRHSKNKNKLSYVEHNIFRLVEQEQNELCRTQYVSSYRTRT
jgi:hypothetical protein